MTVIAVTLPLSLAYAGLTALALAMKRHHQAALGAKPPAARLRAFRLAGWLLIALMVASCLRLWPTGLALSMALGLVTLAGLPLVFLLPYRPQLMVRLATILPVLALIATTLLT